MTYDDALSRVTRILRNYSKNMWGELEIHDYLNDGYKEFVRLTHCLHKHGQIIVETDTSLYNIPSDCIVIYRMEWNGKQLPVHTTREMDKLYGGYDWRSNEGEYIQCVIQDGEGYPQIRIYPILPDAEDIGNIITGTDSNKYRCTTDHTSSSSNKPITGSDYDDYWELYTGNGSASTWADSTEYYEYNELELDYIYLPTELPVIVTGTDSKRYKCILDHTSVTETNKPITGENYSTYWSEYVGEKTAGTWTNSTVYAGYTYDIPSIYHMALIEYALSQCQMAEVQSQKKINTSAIHYDKFMKMVRSCRVEVERGFAVNKQPQIYAPSFI